jgi:hypothetical protein
MTESATVNVAEEPASEAMGSKLTGRVALVTGGTRGIGADRCGRFQRKCRAR